MIQDIKKSNNVLKNVKDMLLWYKIFGFYYLANTRISNLQSVYTLNCQ